MKQLRKIAHKVFQDACKKEWDTWREYYDDLSIDDLIFINMGIDAFIREQKCLAVDGVVEILGKMYVEGVRKLDIIELGCYRGGLADQVLRQFPKMVKSWVGYDINYYALEETICEDGRYGTVKQTEWFYDLEFFNRPNLFVSTSTLEHHNREQFEKILKKLRKTQSIKHIVIGLPVSPAGWMGYGGSHVLNMNQEEISQAIENIGFNIFYFERHKVYMWGASR